MSQASRSRFLLAFITGTYGVLFWLFLRFLEVDTCADAGGVFDTASGTCVNYRPDEFIPILERPWVFWLFAVAIPAPPVAALSFLVRRLLTSHAISSPTHHSSGTR